MRETTVTRSSKATSVWLMDAEVTLQRFNTTTSEQDEDTEPRELCDGNSWSDLRKFLYAAVANKEKAKAVRHGRSKG
jgi:hypothetical protein